MSLYLRLAISGLLLDRQAFREQRDAPDGFRRGLIVVVLVSFLVSLAALVGSLLSTLVNPTPQTAAATVAAALSESDWWQRQPAEVREVYNEEVFTQVLGVILPAPTDGLLGLLLGPLFALIGWGLYGLLGYFAARLAGGTATLRQTMACTALASGAQLLGLTQALPSVLVSGLLNQAALSQALAQIVALNLLMLFGNYLALREAHQIGPWPAFAAALVGPSILLVLFSCGLCMVLFTLLAVAGGA